MEGAIHADHRHFPAVHHDTRSGFGLSGQFDDMTMLRKRIYFQVDARRVFALGNDSKPVLLTFHRLPVSRIIGLHHPVVGSLVQARHDHISRVHLAIHNGRGEIGVARDAQTVSHRVGHLGPGKLYRLGLSRGKDRHHIGRGNRRGWPDLLQLGHAR